MLGERKEYLKKDICLTLLHPIKMIYIKKIYNSREALSKCESVVCAWMDFLVGGKMNG